MAINEVYSNKSNNGQTTVISGQAMNIRVSVKVVSFFVSEFELLCFIVVTSFS